MEKRQSAQFPQLDMHTRVVVGDGQPNFFIYEQYDTWFLRELKRGNNGSKEK